MIKPTLTLLASALIMIAVSAQAAHNKKTTPAPKNPSTHRIHIPLHSYPNGVQKKWTWTIIPLSADYYRR